MTIKNIGVSAAKNAAVSIDAPNISFINFTSTPYLSKGLERDVSTNGSGYAKINLIPPGAQVRITAAVDASNSQRNETITPFVISDEGVGKYQQQASILFYILLGVILTGTLLVLIRRIGEVTLREFVLGLVIILAYMAIYFVLYLLLFGSLLTDISNIRIPLQWVICQRLALETSTCPT
jgi:hypothetical protein